MLETDPATLPAPEREPAFDPPPNELPADPAPLAPERPEGADAAGVT